jgi:PAS domain S-box-containing protein
MIAALENGEWQVVISDYRLPAFSGPEALSVLKEKEIDLPFIIVSGTVGEVSAVDAMRAGAHDYVMKGNLLRLIPAIERELHEAETRRQRSHAMAALNESEQRFRTVADSVPLLLWISDVEANCVYVNKPWLDFTGRTSEEEMGTGWQAHVHPDDLPDCMEVRRQALAGQQPYQTEYRLRRHDGDWRWVLETGTPRHHPAGVFTGYLGTCVDLTDRKRAELEREAILRENALLLQEKAEAVLQQRAFLKDVLLSVTEGKLHLCDSRSDLPAPLSAVSEPISLSATALSAVRRATEEAARRLELPDERVMDFITAVAEASMNAVVHAGGGEAQFYDGADTAQVWIADNGLGIDIRQLPRATLERGYTTANSLGHGFFMMLACADRVYLLTGSEGTTIVLEQYHTRPVPAWLNRTPSWTSAKTSLAWPAGIQA